MVGDHFYVGRSARTNEEGIRQFIAILEKYGLSGSEVKLEKVLHLKTGVNYIENNKMLVSGEFIDKPEFAQYEKYIIPEDEAYAAKLHLDEWKSHRTGSFSEGSADRKRCGI